MTTHPLFATPSTLDTVAEDADHARMMAEARARGGRPDCLTCGGTGVDDLFDSPCMACANSPDTYRRAPAHRTTPRAEAERVDANATYLAELVTWARANTWADFAAKCVRLYDAGELLTPGQVAALDRMRTRHETPAAVPVATTTAPPAIVRPSFPAGSTTGTRARVEPGFYLVGLICYRVDQAKETGNTYARPLDPRTGRFEYVRGAINDVRRVGVRMSLTDAAAYGRRTGRCCVCAATLTDPKSIAAGIGPVCAKRF